MEHQTYIRRPDTEAADLIILATRSWVRAAFKEKHGQDREWYKKAWDSCFEVVGSSAAAKIHDAFLKHFSRLGKKQFVLGCACCGRVSADERRLVDMIRALQEGDLEAAQDTLSYWFDNEAMWEAEALCEAFADQLAINGFMVEGVGTFVYSVQWTGKPKTVN